MSIFNYFGKAFRHMELMDRMMDAVGVTGKLKSLPGAANVLRRASARCRTCKYPGSCEVLLDNNELLDEAPRYCRNHDLFIRLKQEIEAEKAAA
ncbi:MAG: DUF6455 family protein [Rhizobiaceae bacterium]